MSSLIWDVSYSYLTFKDVVQIAINFVSNETSSRDKRSMAKNLDPKNQRWAKLNQNEQLDEKICSIAIKKMSNRIESGSILKPSLSGPEPSIDFALKRYRCYVYLTIFLTGWRLFSLCLKERINRTLEKYNMTFIFLCHLCLFYFTL